MEIAHHRASKPNSWHPATLISNMSAGIHITHLKIHVSVEKKLQDGLNSADGIILARVPVSLTEEATCICHSCCLVNGVLRFLPFSSLPLSHYLSTILLPGLVTALFLLLLLPFTPSNQFHARRRLFFSSTSHRKTEFLLFPKQHFSTEHTRSHITRSPFTLLQHTTTSYKLIPLQYRHQHAVQILHGHDGFCCLRSGPCVPAQ